SKRTEEALRRSQETLMRAQSIAHLGHMERDAITGENVWSDETFRILGFEPQSFVPGENQTLGAIPIEEREWVKSVSQALFTEGWPFSIEHRIVRPGGSIRWVQSQAEAVRDETGKIARYVCTLLDI